METPQKHMFSYYIGSLSNVVSHFTCVVTSQVYMNIWMQWGIALSSAFYKSDLSHTSIHGIA